MSEWTGERTQELRAVLLGYGRKSSRDWITDETLEALDVIDHLQAEVADLKAELARRIRDVPNTPTA